MNIYKFFLAFALFFVFSFVTSADLFAAENEIGSVCSSNAECDFNGGVCVPDINDNGEPTGSGVCSSTQLLAAASIEVVGEPRVLAQTDSTGSVLNNLTTSLQSWQLPDFIFGPKLEEAHTADPDPTADHHMRYSSGWVTLGLLDQVTAGAGAPVVASANGGNSFAQRPGAIFQLTMLTDKMLVNPPVSSVEYIADIGRNAGIVTDAYAQGAGWLALTPVLEIWKAFRNIAYFFFVIVFIVVGFMIMFRKQLGGQAVVTIQMALPQIITTLLLITFSYAIVALMIDMIYVLIYFVISIFSTFGILDGVEGAGKATEILMTNSIFGVIFEHIIGWGDLAGGAASSIASIVDTIFTDLTAEVGGKIAGFISGGLAYLIIAVFILFSVFKVFFQIIKAYIGIIFGVIFAPILLLMNVIPGSNAFQSWFKSLVANALVFPVLAIMLLVGAALVGNSNYASRDTSGDFGVKSDVGYQGWQNNEDVVALPFLALNTNAMLGIIGLGFIIMLPNVIEMLYKMLGVEPGISGALQGAAAGMLNIPGKVGGAALTGLGYVQPAADLARVGGMAGRSLANWRERRRRAGGGAETPTTKKTEELADKRLGLGERID